MSHEGTFMLQCITSKHVWAFIATMIVLVAGYFLLEYNEEDMRATLDSRMRFFVRNAFLTRLTYNNTTNTLHYNLTVEVAIPAEHATIDYLSAAVSYHNITFASHPVETLIQDFNGLRLRFDGERYIMLTHVQLSKVNYDNMSGFYNLTLNLWPPKMRTPEELLCDLQLPIHHYVRCNGIDD